MVIVKPVSQVTKLQEVYTEYGYPSVELKNQIDKYITYLLHRFYRDFNTSMDKNDLIQECYLKLSKSLKYYDKKKGTLATFVFTALRNTIGYLKRKEEKQKRFSDSYGFVNIENIDDSLVPVYQVIDVLDKQVFVNNLVDNFLSLKLSDSFKKDFSYGLCSYVNLEKFIRWKTTFS